MRTATGQRRILGGVVLLVGLLAGCTATSADGSRTPSSPPAHATTSSAAATSHSTGQAATPSGHTVTAPSSSSGSTAPDTTVQAPVAPPMTTPPVTTGPDMTPPPAGPDTTASTTAASTTATAVTTTATAPSTPATTPLTAVTTAVTTTPAVTAPGVELPGGGYTMFPGRTLVALYGHPGAPSLGALGQQDLDASIARAKQVAGTYRGRVAGPVIPTFEIIATVATGGPGADGTYSAKAPVSKLRPWIDAATKAGMYVILDLQPGRANLLSQANAYVDLLRLPNVGLAIDPEWKLAPGQRPLQGIGGVDAAEVNSVIAWLSRLTAANHLPQKVLVLHQFQLSMLRDEQQIVTDDDNVTVLIHMDGQGSPAAKNSTWAAVTGAAPSGVFFGWKNFFAKDRPMLDQPTTLARKPVPVMISYQ